MNNVRLKFEMMMECNFWWYLAIANDKITDKFNAMDQGFANLYLVIGAKVSDWFDGSDTIKLGYKFNTDGGMIKL